jgi:hypothetical protein
MGGGIVAMKAVIICLSILSPALALSGGIQGGLASPNDLGFYAGGHLDPTYIVPNLLLHLPAEIMVVNNFTDFSVGAQARYCFTGQIGFFAGGGLRLHISQHDSHHDGGESHSGLGLDITGGYTFGGRGFRFSPELTLMAFEVDSINVGCAFTF